MMTSACMSAIPCETRGPAAFPVGVRQPRSGALFLGNAEPGIEEMMADDVIRRVMDRDGVGVDQLRSLMDEVRTRLL